MDYLKAFLVGGCICAIVQVFLDKTKLTAGRIMVGLVCLGAILGAFNLYQPIVNFAGYGASVPLTGFGDALMKGVKDAISTDGFIGVFKGGFTASAIGISGVLVFAYIASFIFNSKIQE